MKSLFQEKETHARNIFSSKSYMQQYTKVPVTAGCLVNIRRAGEIYPKEIFSAKMC